MIVFLASANSASCSPILFLQNSCVRTALSSGVLPLTWKQCLSCPHISHIWDCFCKLRRCGCNCCAGRVQSRKLWRLPAFGSVAHRVGTSYPCSFSSTTIKSRPAELRSSSFTLTHTYIIRTWNILKLPNTQDVTRKTMSKEFSKSVWKEIRAEHFQFGFCLRANRAPPWAGSLQNPAWNCLSPVGELQEVWHSLASSVVMQWTTHSPLKF